jgi:hypothetical protein
VVKLKKPSGGVGELVYSTLNGSWEQSLMMGVALQRAQTSEGGAFLAALGSAGVTPGQPQTLVVADAVTGLSTSVATDVSSGSFNWVPGTTSMVYAVSIGPNAGIWRATITH